MRKIIGILLALILAGCDNPLNSTSDTEHVSRAQTYLDSGKLKSASIELKNALTKNPDNAQARWLLGKLYIEIGNGLAAEKELIKARQLGVNDDSTVPLLLESLLIQKKYDDVVDFDISGIHSSSAIANALASKGLAYMLLGNLEKAQQELDNALLKEPDSPYALVGRARLSALKRELEDAHKYLKKALSIDNNYAIAWGLAGDIASIEQKPDIAIDAYSKAIEHHVDNTADLLKRAKLYIGLKQLDNAQNDINILKLKRPNNAEVHYWQGVLYFLKKQFPEAQAALERSLESKDYNMRAAYYLGASHFFQGNFAQAKDYLTRFVIAAPQFIPARKLLAQIKLQDKEYKHVENLLRPVIQLNPNDTIAINILADALLKQEKTDEAIKLLEKAVDIQPDTATAYTRLGLGLLMHGEKERANENLKNAIKIDPESQQADVALILSHLREGAFDAADKAAKSFIDRQPKNAIAHSMLGMIYLAKKQYDKAEQSFLQASKLSPGNPYAGHQLSALAIQNNNLDKAHKYLSEVLKHHPKHLRTLLGLAAIEERQGDTKAMMQTLKLAAETNPNAIQPRILMARALFKENEIEQARLVLGDILEQQRKNPEVLTLVGELQLAAKEFANAKATFKQLTELQPENAELHFLLAKSYYGLGDIENFKKELSKSLALSENYIPAKIALSRIAMLEGDIDSAYNSLLSIKKDSEENADTLLLEGELLARLNRPKEALATFKKLFDKKPNTSSLLTLTTFLWSLGNHDESVYELEKWIKNHPKDVSAMLALANNYFLLGRKDESSQIYRKVLAISENNLLALNNLAWQIKETDLDQALSLANRAYTINPDSPVILDTLAMLLMEDGQIELANRYIERALEKKPNDPTLIYHSILLKEKNGNKEEAASDLRKLLEKNPKFSDSDEAKELLERLEQGK